MISSTARSQTRRLMQQITVDVADSFASANVSCEEWDEFVRDVDGDLYVTSDWCRIWWRHYGENRHLRLYVFRKADRLVGLAPMFIERVRIGPISLKIAKRVGADFALTIFALPFAADYVEVAYRELITKLIKDENCDAVSFSFMPSNDPTLVGLRRVCQCLPELVVVTRDAPAGPHTVFQLPDSLEAYLATLDSRQRQNYRRRLKLLKKTFHVQTDVISEHFGALEAFDNFKILHASQWQAEGKPGHFGDWPNSASFNADLVGEMSRLGRFRMTRILAEQKVIAFQYAFVFGDCCYWRLPARAAEKELDRFGLGVLGMVHLFDAMMRENIRRVEAGMGHYDYKMQFGGEELKVRSFLITAVRPGAALRARLFLRISDLLHFFYYRVWRLRLASRLPLSRRPLSRTWIRCRI
jgi:CelD/BcsL family acetyltransferase involved in cellulose biosynthesis